MTAKMRFILQPDYGNDYANASEEDRARFRTTADRVFKGLVPEDAIKKLDPLEFEFEVDPEASLVEVAAAMRAFIKTMDGDGNAFDIESNETGDKYLYCIDPKTQEEICYHQYPLLLNGTPMEVRSNGAVNGHIAVLCEYVVKK